MADIWQRTFSNAFSCMKIYEFRVIVHWSLFLIQMNNIPALVQIMAWRRPGGRPSSESMMVSLLTHIYVSLPQLAWDEMWYIKLGLLSSNRSNISSGVLITRCNILTYCIQYCTDMGRLLIIVYTRNKHAKYRLHWRAIGCRRLRSWRHLTAFWWHCTL